MVFKSTRKRILVIKSRAIGDTVLLTGPLKLLRQNFPDHDIHALVRSPAGEILEGLPYVDRIISAHEPRKKIDRISYWVRMVRKLRELQYEKVLNFHASFRTALTARLLRAEVCITNHHELKGRNWFSDREVPGRGVVKGIIDRDLDVLRALGIQAKMSDAYPEIFLHEVEKKEALGLISRHPNYEKESRLIFLGIGAGRETKRWPTVKMFELVESLLKKHPELRFVITSVDADRSWMKEFQLLLEKSRPIRDALLHFQKLRLRQAAAVLSQCQIYIGNDSGLKHIAVALGLPSFSFFGPEAPLEWHPYERSRHDYAFIENLACRTESGDHWCSIPVCKVHAHQCMNRISANDIIPQIERLIGN